MVQILLVLEVLFTQDSKALQAYVLFNSISVSVISEGKLGDYERLCVSKLGLRLERLLPPALNLLSYRGFRL